MVPNTKAQHTPTPWKIITPYSEKERLRVQIIANNKLSVAHYVIPANAAFIVRAVNAHEALISCVQSALAYMHDDYVGESIDLEKAIAEALKLAVEP